MEKSNQKRRGRDWKNKCRKRGQVDIIDKAVKGNRSEEEEIVIRKYRIQILVDIIDKEVKGYIYSLKQQETAPETTKTKKDIILENMKIKVERSALEWDYLMVQEHLESLIYVDSSLYVYLKIDRLTCKLNFKNCMRFKKKTTSNCFVGIADKNR